MTSSFSYDSSWTIIISFSDISFSNNIRHTISAISFQRGIPHSAPTISLFVQKQKLGDHRSLSVVMRTLLYSSSHKFRLLHSQPLEHTPLFWWIWRDNGETLVHLKKWFSNLHSRTSMPYSLWDTAVCTCFITVSRALQPYLLLQRSTYVWGVTELKYEVLYIYNGTSSKCEWNGA